jgi:hypothetical protein
MFNIVSLIIGFVSLVFALIGLTLLGSLSAFYWLILPFFVLPIALALIGLVPGLLSRRAGGTILNLFVIGISLAGLLK